MFDPHYEAQVRLLLQCLPEVARQDCFALKGGTAINLFVRDLPRVSVDIDLAYLPLRERDEALAEISRALLAIKTDIEHRIAESKVQKILTHGTVTKLIITTDLAQTKIEPNLVLRGAIHEPKQTDLSPIAQEHFQAFVSTRILAEPDLYGGKLCAALDRQHPRDLFDVKPLLDGNGITPAIRRAFVVYLASHSRPMNELLNPNFLDVSDVYERQLVGMSRIPVTLTELLNVRERVAREILAALDTDERDFLLSMQRGSPEWDRLGIQDLDQMPALRWKLINVRKMSDLQRAQAVARLEAVLAQGR